jgi:hypothetical protein
MAVFDHIPMGEEGLKEVYLGLNPRLRPSEAGGSCTT